MSTAYCAECGLVLIHAPSCSHWTPPGKLAPILNPDGAAEDAYQATLTGERNEPAQPQLDLLAGVR